MPPRPCRRPAVFDLVVAVAATAATIGMYRWLYPPLGSWPIWRMHLWSQAEVVLFVTAMIDFTWPCLLVGTPAFAAIRLYGERPRRARLMCQPGAVACLTALAYAATIGLVNWPIRAAAFLQAPGPSDRSELTFAICRSNTGVGYAVVAAWLVLALGGRWRPERGWIDRLGRLLGIGWVVWSASYTLCPHL